MQSQSFRRGGAIASGESRSQGPIRVLHVMDVLSLSGMEYGVIKLVNRLDAERFSPSICCLRYESPDAVRLLDRRVPVSALRKPPGRDLRVIHTLSRLIRRERIQIVHSHNWSTFLYSVAAAKLAGVDAIVHGEHGREGPGATPPRRLAACRWLARQVSHVVCVSDSLRRDLIREWRLRPSRLTAIPNGVDMERFGSAYPLEALRRELRLEPSDVVVMSVGAFRPVKDYPALLRGFARVRAEVANARLLLVGGDQGQELQAGLEQLAVDLGIAESVRFAGMRNDIPELLGLCDVYVNTSTYEGMSNTILEAMAARRPVVATAVGGNPELVRDGRTGLLVPPSNEEEVARALVSLLANPSLRRTLGAAGRAEVERAHSMEAMVRSYGDLYLDVIAREDRRRAASGRERAKRAGARMLRWSGAHSLATVTTSPELAILMYHRVLPWSEALNTAFSAMVMPSDLFEAQVERLARNYDVLDFPEALRLLHARRLPRRAVVLTFDDGYADNHTHALPILKHYRVPATFFLVTGALDRKLRLWWDVVAECVGVIAKRLVSAPRPNVDLPAWMFPMLGRLRTGTAATDVAREIVDHMNAQPAPAREEALGALHVLLPDKPDHAMMSWDQARDLQRAGMTLGSHTTSHAFLDELEDEQVRHEVAGSIVRLEAELGVPVRHFAYPRGRTRHGLRTVLQELGIEAAVTTVAGCNALDADPLQLRRIDAGYCRLPSGFDSSVFDAEVHGWFGRLRGAHATA